MTRIPAGKKHRDFRNEMLDKQAGLCSLCSTHCSAEEGVLDHAHHGEHKGKIRGVLHRDCNILLGKIENSRLRTGMGIERLDRMLERVHHYMTQDYSENPFHHTHRTDDEKRIRRNKKARERRAKLQREHHRHLKS